MRITQTLFSSVGKKYIMAISGLALVGFSITHLLGNLLLLFPNGNYFNTYAHTLISMGWLLYVAEVGLASVFLIHIFTAVALKRRNSSARPIQYSFTKSPYVATKGGESKSSFFSNRMFWTGLVVGIFLVIHIWQFRLGPGIEEGYQSMVDGVLMRDLFRLVQETFKNPIFCLMYLMVMLFLGFHMRHGFWSLFQSLGIAFPRWTKTIYCMGFFLAFLIAAGFVLIPIWMYFDLHRMIPDSVWEMLA